MYSFVAYKFALTVLVRTAVRLYDKKCAEHSLICSDSSPQTMLTLPSATTSSQCLAVSTFFGRNHHCNYK